MHGDAAATMNAKPTDEPDLGVAARDLHQERPGTGLHGSPAAVGAWPRDDMETDKTPRSEEPPAVAASQQLLASQPDVGYFSPQPIRPYGARLPASTPASARPSPTTSMNSPSLSPGLSSGPSPAAGLGRPGVQRDDSNASTISIATVRAHSVDTSQLFTPFSRQQLDGPYYPNQSYAALQSQPHPAHYPPVTRKGGSHHGHFASLSAAHIRTTGFAPSEHHRDKMDSGSRTVGNSPVSSPGLFSPGPTTPPLRHARQPDDGFYSSPYLHHTHRQAPKETHRADVDVDPVSGRKIINQYEVMDELGRGVHGKVKLGRNLETGQTVAIKIVDRYSKKKRLNRDTSREDKIKEEIAILKKARHPNIVSLLEVIDDPSRKKVYIVLEHVELGEVRWRVVGEKEICLIEWRRYQRESQGVLNHESASIEDEQIINLAHKKLAKQQRRTAKLLRKHRLGHDGNEPWSLELGGESDEELPGSLGSGIGSGRTSRASTRSAAEGPSKHKFAEYHAKGAHVHASSVGTGARSPTPFSSKSQDTDASTALEGTMYGAYDSDFMRGRTSSLAESSSSHFSLEEDDVPEHFRWVPLLTLQNALETFRDTVLGLEFLHFQGVVHRDIKPANLLQTKERRVKISDFGVSYLGRVRLETDDIEESESDMHDAEAIELAKTVGTPAFYAPELCKLDDDGDPFPVSKQIDVWALGVTLYCLIYGRVPFHSTSEFHLMKTIVDEEVFIPRYRLKAVAEQSGSRPSSHGRMYHSMSTDKRLPHELEYEEVDDLLRDLLKRLLVKDPRRRITIPEIKLHPWVLQGLDNFDVWMEQTDPARTSQGKRIEVSKEDMDQAVVPVTLIERVRSGIRKGFESLVRVGTGRSSTRKRAESTATSPDPHHNLSAHSSSSTISQESRRPSLALSQSIFETLSRSRESDHPLSQSVSASPEARDRAKFFESDSRTGSPAYAIESHEYVAPLTTSPRPFGLERGHSDMSSAASVRTIRASDMCPSGRSLSPQIPPAAAGTPTTLEPPSASSLSGILGSVPRLVNTMRSRERLTRSSRRPLDQARAKSDYLGDISDDPHGGPSVALSTAFASGQVDQPDVLKDLSPRATRSRGPSVSEVRSPDPLDKGSSRDSSVSSVSSYFNRPVTYRHRTTDLVCSTESNLHPVKERETPSEANADVEDNRYRRMAEDNECRDNHVASECHRPTPARAPSHCPPSPDDFMSMPSQRQKVEDYLKNGQGTDHNISLEHYQPPKALASSSSEDFPTSLSQSTSNPSIPSVVSATSSVAPDDYSGMRSAYREVHSTYDNAIMNKYALSPSDSFDQLGESTDDPAGYDGDGDHPLDSDYDDDSDDDFIVMGKKKPTPAPARSSNSISNAELARKEVRKSYHTERRRSARSGSNGTVRKIPSDPVSGKQDDTR